jgi:hypothetical protein
MSTTIDSLGLTASDHAAGPSALAGRNLIGRAFAAIWHAMEESGRARARLHILELADRFEALQPDLASELRAASARRTAD